MQLVLELVVRSVNGCKYCDKRPVTGAVTVQEISLLTR